MAAQFGGDVGAAPPPDVGLAAEFRLGAPVRAQGVGILQRPAQRRVPRAGRQQLEHRGRRPAGHPADHGADHHRGVQQLAGTVGLGPPIQPEHREIRRDGVESAGVHDARAGVGGLLVIKVDAVADEVRLTGQVGIVGAGGGAGLHQRQPVLGVGTDGGHHHPGPRGHLLQRGRSRRVRGQDGPGPAGAREGFAHPFETLRGPAGQRHAGTPGRARQVLRGQPADKSRRPVDDDVEFSPCC